MCVVWLTLDFLYLYVATLRLGIRPFVGKTKWYQSLGEDFSKSYGEYPRLKIQKRKKWNLIVKMV